MVRHKLTDSDKMLQLLFSHGGNKRPYCLKTARTRKKPPLSIPWLNLFGFLALTLSHYTPLPPLSVPAVGAGAGHPAQPLAGLTLLVRSALDLPHLVWTHCVQSRAADVANGHGHRGRLNFDPVLTLLLTCVNSQTAHLIKSLCERLIERTAQSVKKHLSKRKRVSSCASSWDLLKQPWFS